MVDAGTVEIRRKGAGFVVVCSPPDPAHPPRCFVDKREAYGWAGGLRLALGRRKVDLTEGGTHADKG